MKPVIFDGHNIVLGKGQPQYIELPALRCNDASGTVWSCWEPDEADIADLIKHRKLWVGQLSFRGPFSPQMVTASMPFEVSVAVNKARQAARAVALPEDPEEVLP